jgi:membrane protein implicated in regulation of membrane protease activity
MGKAFPFICGVAVGVVLTLFMSLFTEFILLVVAAAILIYGGRKRWNNTHSTTKTSPSSSPSPTDRL